MKKIAILFILAFVLNSFGWGGFSGKVHRVWVNGWPNKPNIVCFEIMKDDNVQYYSIKRDATEENKNRILSILLSAQSSGSTVIVYYHPDGGHGEKLERGNDVINTYAVQSVSIAPEKITQ